jgi:hypothetical protein
MLSIGMTKSETTDEITLEKVLPITNPTAKSITLPLMAKFLNSERTLFKIKNLLFKNIQ